MIFLAVFGVTTVDLAVHPSALGAIAIALLWGGGVPSVRIAIWKKRHPIITPEEFMHDIRSRAGWN